MFGKVEEKILYYLGAGASVNVLPLARTIQVGEKTIAGLSSSLSTFDFKLLLHELSRLNLDKTQFLPGLNTRFKKLGSEALKFGDVDTYAKYLFLMQRD